MSTPLSVANQDALRRLWLSTTSRLDQPEIAEFRSAMMSATEQLTKGPVCLTCTSQGGDGRTSSSTTGAPTAEGIGYIGVLSFEGLELYVEQYVWTCGARATSRGPEDLQEPEVAYLRQTPQGQRLLATESVDTFLTRLRGECAPITGPLPTTVVFSRHFAAPQRPRSPGPQGRRERWDVYDPANRSHLIGRRFVQMIDGAGATPAYQVTLEDWVWPSGALPSEIYAVRAKDHASSLDRGAFLDEFLPSERAYPDDGCSHVMELRCYFADWWSGLGPRPSMI